MRFTQRSFQLDIDDHTQNKIDRLSVGDAFTEYLDLLPGKKTGYKMIPSHLFPTLLNKVKTSEDIVQVKNIIADFLGHRNKISNTNLDNMMAKCLEIDASEMLEFFTYHRQIFYYPHPDIMDMYVDYMVKQEDYENTTQKLINATVKELWLKKSDNYYNSLIKCAHENGDSESVVLLYVNILEYSKTKLNAHSLNCVMDSIDLDNEPLFSNVNEYAQSHQVDGDFCTYLINASRVSEDPTKMNEYLQKAIETADSTGNHTLIKSERIKQEVLVKHRDHNSLVQQMLKSYPGPSVHPKDAGYYEWTDKESKVQEEESIEKPKQSEETKPTKEETEKNPDETSDKKIKESSDKQ